MIPEKLAELRFNHHGNMISLNNVLYQLGIRNGEKADAIGKEHLFKAIEAYDMTSKKFKDRAFKKICKRNGI